MLPKEIGNLIEAYAQDMALYEELRKTKVNHYVIKKFDRMFYDELIWAIPFFYDVWCESSGPQVAGILQEMVRNNELCISVLLKICINLDDYWKNGPGHWCIIKLWNMDNKRRKIWNDIGISCSEDDNQILKKWFRKSRYLAIDTSFYEQFMEYTKQFTDIKEENIIVE